MTEPSQFHLLRRRHYIRHRIIQNTVRLIPMCLVLGGAMELFMLNTGFYEVVKRKEAEKIIEKRNNS